MTTKILSAIEEFERALDGTSLKGCTAIGASVRGKIYEHVRCCYANQTDEDFIEEMRERDAEFIALAANKATLFTQALKKSVETLQSYCDNKCAHQNPCMAREAITEIERILEGK